MTVLHSTVIARWMGNQANLETRKALELLQICHNLKPSKITERQEWFTSKVKDIPFSTKFNQQNSSLINGVLLPDQEF
jgi:hypothetical protein